MTLSFEGTDSPAVGSLPVPHQLVALAVDPDQYFPIGSAQRWALSFVGALYPNRSPPCSIRFCQIRDSRRSCMRA